MDRWHGYNSFNYSYFTFIRRRRHATFSAEAPGPNSDKLHPRITDTAKRLWYIYVGFTLTETLLLNFAGMSFFDAINNSMSTIATGGFSTKNASIAYWNYNPIIQYIIIFFMFISGANFVLSYFAFTGRIQKILRDEEFKTYFIFILISFIMLVLFCLIVLIYQNQVLNILKFMEN